MLYLANTKYIQIFHGLSSLNSKKCINEKILPHLENNLSSTKFPPFMKTNSNAKKELSSHSTLIAIYVSTSHIHFKLIQGSYIALKQNYLAQKPKTYPQASLKQNTCFGLVLAAQTCTMLTRTSTCCRLFTDFFVSCASFKAPSFSISLPRLRHEPRPSLCTRDVHLRVWVGSEPYPNSDPNFRVGFRLGP